MWPLVGRSKVCCDYKVPKEKKSTARFTCYQNRPFGRSIQIVASSLMHTIVECCRISYNLFTFVRVSALLLRCVCDRSDGTSNALRRDGTLTRADVDVGPYIGEMDTLSLSHM